MLYINSYTVTYQTPKQVRYFAFASAIEQATDTLQLQMSDLNSNSTVLNCDACGVSHPHQQHRWSVRTATVDQLVCNNCISNRAVGKLLQYREIYTENKPMIICKQCLKFKGSGLHQELCDPCHVKHLSASTARLADSEQGLKNMLYNRDQALDALREMNQQLVKEVCQLKLNVTDERVRNDKLQFNIQGIETWLKQLAAPNQHQAQEEQVDASSHISANSQANNSS